MVGLDLVRVVRVVRGRLDDVGVERPLGEEVDRPQPRRLLLEDADEGRADPAALLLGVDHPGERVEKLVGGVDVDEVDVALGAHDVDDPVALAAPEQPVVDEDAGQLVTDGAMHERRRDGRVDAAAERADHLAIADLVAQRVDGHLDERRGLPCAGAPADVEEEVAQDVAPERCVRDLGMELDAVSLPGPTNAAHGGVERMRDRPESGGRAVTTSPCDIQTASSAAALRKLRQSRRQ